MACVDKFNIPIKIGDSLLVHSASKITLCKVCVLDDEHNTVYVDCINHGFEPNKCVVITDQVKSNLKEYPEHYYHYCK